MINLIEYALTRRKLTSDVSDYLDEHLTNPTNPPIDNSLAIEGAAADAKATGDAISALNAELTVISVISSLDSNSYEHTVSSYGRSLTVTGTTFPQTVKIANSSGHVPSSSYYKDNTSLGTTVKPYGRGINIDGTFTSTSGRRVLTNNPILPEDLIGKTVTFRCIADKAITFTNGASLTPELRFLINGSKKFGIELPVNTPTVLDLTQSFSIPSNFSGRAYSLAFENLQADTDFDDVNIVFLMYEDGTTITDTEITLEEGVTQTFDIPSACESVIDTGVHESTYYGVVSTKDYVDNTIPEGVVVESGLPYVTPQMYGAKGDGVTDDTTALQNFLNGAFDSQKIAYIPSGTYNHTGLTFPAQTSSTTAFTPTIKGCDRSSTILNHTGSGVGVSIAPRTGTGNISGISVSDLKLTGNSNTTIGLEISDGYKVDIHDLYVIGASQSCIEMSSVWLSAFNRIYCRPDSSNASGFIMSGGSCQHNSIDALMVQSPTNVGIEIRGGTTTVGNLACDNASGEIAYNIIGFKGHITGIGCENPTAKRIVNFQMSQVTVSELGFLNYVPPEDYYGYAFNINASLVTINELKTYIGADAEMQTLTGAFFNVYYGHVIINQMEGQQTFEALTVDGSQNAYATLTINDRSSSVSIRKNHERPYIGTDRAGIDTEVTGESLLDKSTWGNAIFLDCTGQSRYKSDGTDCTTYNPVNKGDWFIESDPATYNVAGYVIRESCTTLTANNSKERPIPLILYGATADRPTAPFIGMMFFDTTLGKPIWYSGESWVDYSGASV